MNMHRQAEGFSVLRLMLALLIKPPNLLFFSVPSPRLPKLLKFPLVRLQAL